MNLSLTTDYITDTGNPLPYLKAIAAAGFSHIHWCHQWNTDTLYSAAEIQEIGMWLRDLGLSLLDLHATEGHETRWVSINEEKRKAGMALVINRMEMTSTLKSDTIVLHIPWFDGPNPDGWLEPACRSLDALEPVHKQTGVRIALENIGNDENWARLEELFRRYPASYIGLCYDSGHGNFNRPSMENLARLKERLITVHLHDNDGASDQHLIPFYGSVDWKKLMLIISQSSYAKCINLESAIKNHSGWDEKHFLSEAYKAGTRLTNQLNDAA